MSKHLMVLAVYTWRPIARQGRMDSTEVVYLKGGGSCLQRLGPAAVSVCGGGLRSLFEGSTRGQNDASSFPLRPGLVRLKGNIRRSWINQGGNLRGICTCIGVYRPALSQRERGAV